MGTERAFVIGHPIRQSRSPMMHNHWIAEHGLDAVYDRRDVPPEDLATFFDEVRRERYIGANVTIPHKLAVMEHLDDVDDAARAMGAVNCIAWVDGRLTGGNTDAMGFLANMDEVVPGWDAGAGHAVVYGAGGAARAAAYGLRSRGLTVALCNRTPDKAVALAAHLGEGISGHGSDALPVEMARADVLVNTTSLGMIGQPPIDLDLAFLKPEAVVYDIVYVPLETGLLAEARARGHRTVDGLGMLIYQGVEGFRRWFGVTPVVSPALRKLLEDDIRGSQPGA